MSLSPSSVTATCPTDTAGRPQIATPPRLATGTTPPTNASERVTVGIAASERATEVVTVPRPSIADGIPRPIGASPSLSASDRVTMPVATPSEACMTAALASPSDACMTAALASPSDARRTVPLASPIAGPLTVAMDNPYATPNPYAASANPPRRILSPASIPMPLLQPRPRLAATPSRPRAAIGIALVYAVLAFVLAPLAPIAWMHATEQLDLIERGACRASGITALRIANGIGIAMTMLAVAATAFGVTVLVARYLA